MSNELIFVYNAKSGMLNAMLDSMHKVISPDTYQCQLCKITYGAFTELSEWKQFRSQFEGDMSFLHIDEFEVRHPPADSYPVIYERDTQGQLSVVADSNLINGMRDIHALIQFCRDWALLAA